MGEVGASPTLSRNCNCSQSTAIEVRLPAETAINNIPRGQGNDAAKLTTSTACLDFREQGSFLLRMPLYRSQTTRPNGAL